MNPTLLPRALAALALLAGAAAVQADVLVDNLDQPLRHPAPLHDAFWYAQSFITPGGTALAFEAVTVRLGGLQGDPTLVAQLRADAADAPGVSLLTFTVPPVSAGAPADVALAASGPLTLAPATTYWLLLGATGGGYDWWYAQGNGASGSGSFGNYSYTENQGAGWTGLGNEDPLMMRIEVSPVPEPSTYVLMAIGLVAGLLRLGRRR